MSINEERLKEWIEQVTKKLAHLEANQMAIINGDFCDTNTEPKEPLIKDEKIRKAVRAWAEANDIERVWHEKASCWLRGNGLAIEMENEVFDLEQGNFSIAELCGTPPEPLEPTFTDLDERIKEKGEE